jgi:hypothetical protein
MKLTALPLPSANNLVGPSFFRNVARAAKAAGAIKQFAVHCDLTPIQLIPGDPTPATNTYQVKIVDGDSEETAFIWVKNAHAAIARETLDHFMSSAHGSTLQPMPLFIAFAASMPDSYFLGGAISIDVNFNVATGKVYKGMRFCKIDGETDLTLFTLPKSATEVFPYLGKGETFVTANILPMSMPLIMTVSNAAGTVTKTVIPVKYKGKITEVLAAGSTATARQASYYDVCPPTPATHFAVYDHSDPAHVTLTLEARP